MKEKEVVGTGRRNGGCYKCNSSDRERLIYLYLKEKFEVFNQPNDIKILHIAPEKNKAQAILQCGYDNYICGDLYAEGYTYSRHVQNINILNIPFDDNYFDLVICNHVLEHVKNDTDAMKELYRVLKIGGKAILQVPLSKNMDKTFEYISVTDPKEREIVFGQFDHVRIYGHDYFDRLQSEGFKTDCISISEEFIKFGVTRDENIIIGNKEQTEINE